VLAFKGGDAAAQFHLLVVGIVHGVPRICKSMA
jgi:hypothetical protein